MPDAMLWFSDIKNIGPKYRYSRSYLGAVFKNAYFTFFSDFKKT